MQNITPHLWFDKEAREAAEFYVSAFGALPTSMGESRLKTTSQLHDTPSGDVDTVAFTLLDFDFMAISAGPLFSPNPSISFFVNFDPSRDEQAKEHLDALWETLSEGGTPLMPLQEYPFSKRYGWIQDKYGVSWQLILTDPEGEPRPSIVPSLLFTQEKDGQAEEAINFYVDVFQSAKVGQLARHPEDTGMAKQGSLMFGDFQLENVWLAAMDGGQGHAFTFNEAISLMVHCDTQEEIDSYWEKLSAHPESEQCGWLKDKYGVSWQVVPTALDTMMSNGTPEQVARVTQAFLQMKKLDIEQLQAAYNQD